MVENILQIFAPERAALKKMLFWTSQIFDKMAFRLSRRPRPKRFFTEKMKKKLHKLRVCRGHQIHNWKISSGYYPHNFCNGCHVAGQLLWSAVAIRSSDTLSIWSTLGLIKSRSTNDHKHFSQREIKGFANLQIKISISILFLIALKSLHSHIFCIDQPKLSIWNECLL